jgi:hypothetical protein
MIIAKRYAPKLNFLASFLMDYRQTFIEMCSSERCGQTSYLNLLYEYLCLRCARRTKQSSAGLGFLACSSLFIVKFDFFTELTLHRSVSLRSVHV